MNTEQLHDMIDRYFSGDLSLKEEQRLLSLLLSDEERDRKAEEALAVMSLMRLRPSRTRKASGFKAIAAAAAAVAVITGLFFLFHRSATRLPDCYAYVEGNYIDNPDEVSFMINCQLEEMGAASRATSEEALSELEEMRHAMEAETTYDPPILRNSL